jgi:hypothetical protein
VKVIGIGGLAQAGKSTAAAAIAAEMFNRNWTPVMERFAGPLKDASKLVGFEKGTKYESQYRQFCQVVGSMARDLDPDWWVKRMQRRLDDIVDAEASDANSRHPWHERVVLIDDVRYENEVKLIRQYGGKMLFVCAALRLGDMDAPWRQHASEALALGYTRGELPEDLFDIQLNNNSPDEEKFREIVAALGVRLLTDANEEIR